MTWLVPLMLMILCVAGSSWDNSKGSIIGSLPGSWLPFSRSSRTRKLSLASRMTDRECSVVTGRHPSTMLRSPCCLESESTLSTRVRGTWVSQSVNFARSYVVHIKLCLYTFEHNALSSYFCKWNTLVRLWPHSPGLQREVWHQWDPALAVGVGGIWCSCSDHSSVDRSQQPEK